MLFPEPEKPPGVCSCSGRYKEDHFLWVVYLGKTTYRPVRKGDSLKRPAAVAAGLLQKSEKNQMV